MNKVILFLAVMLLSAIPAMSADGVINVRSNFDVEETANRIERI